jgi:4-amino-4-deoxy-L-arabinose transferase-like glycosyltransferase
MLVALSTLAHLLCLDRFGWFRDELYYLACGAHPAWGYVDHPPLIGWMGALVGWAHSFLLVRSVPILAGAAAIALTCRMAGKLGAGPIGRLVAGLATLCTPTFLFMFHHLNMNAIEVVLWTAGALIALDLDERAPTRRWLLFGAVVGLGLLNKHSMGFWVLAIAAGLLLGGRGRVFLSKKPWLALLVAALIVAPHVAWQVANHFPTLEFYRNAAAQKNAPLSALGYLGAQITLAGPGNLPLWLLGLVWLVFAKMGRSARPLGFAYLILLALFIVLRGKAYYLVPFYPVLFAAGGAMLDTSLCAKSRRMRVAIAAALTSAVALVGLLAAPLALPVLSPAATVAWGKRLGLAPPKAEKAALGELPQHLADMFGWEELVAALAAARDSLSPAERERIEILVVNYGEAAAVDWLGPGRGLPKAHAAHNAYYTWGPPKDANATVLYLGRPGESAESLQQHFRQARLIGRTHCEYCMPFERDRPIFAAAGWLRPPEESWPALKLYY